jgi:hypothetical protein
MGRWPEATRLSSLARYIPSTSVRIPLAIQILHHRGGMFKNLIVCERRRNPIYQETPAHADDLSACGP